MTLSKTGLTIGIIVGVLLLVAAVAQYCYYKENKYTENANTHLGLAMLWLALGAALILFGLIEMKKAGYSVMSMFGKKNEKYKDLKERYDPMMDKDAELAQLAFAGDYSDYSVQRPTFKSKLAPRFDPYRQGGGYIRGSFPETYDVLSVGANPIDQAEMNAASALDYSTLGGEDKLIAGQQGSCGAARASKYNLAQEVAFAGTDYTNPQDLLPSPDLRSCFKDPTDPGNYMYDRTLFSPLRSRNKNIPDRIRGDLYLEPNRFGWFDSPAIPGVDLARGAIQGIIADMPSSTDLQDTMFVRQNPMMTVKDQETQDTNAWGTSTSKHFM